MITQIICGNPSPILEMQKTLSVISMNLTPLPHAHSPLIQQTFFCFSKSGWSHLLKSTHAAFLLIAWKSIFRRGVVLWSHLGPTSGTTHLMDLVNFFLILSNHFRLQTVRRFSMRTHLSHTLHHFTNRCLPHDEPCSIKPNFILGSSFLCCAWLCCHTHAHPTCSCFSSILPPPCSCIMPLTSIMPALDSIGRSGTNMYIHYDSI